MQVVYISLYDAVVLAHSRLFPDEPQKELKTLQVIALALTELMPLYRIGSREQLTEPELLAERFTLEQMQQLAVPERRFQAALDAMHVTSLDQARASLTLRQSPRITGAR